MTDNNEIEALLKLVDDPDEEVFEAVQTHIISLGDPAIPHLENLWENTIDIPTQQRIEFILHKINFKAVRKEFEIWGRNTDASLMPAITTLCKLQYPDFDADSFITNIQKIRKTTWLELNNYLTPLEQVKILHALLYNYQGIKGERNDPNKISEYIIPKIIEHKKGNQTGIGMLLLLISELLNLPIQLINVPQQFILAWFKPSVRQKKYENAISFFIEPATGQLFALNELQKYFSFIKQPMTDENLLPQNNFEVMQKYLTDFSKCYEHQSSQYKLEEILELKQLISSD